MPFDREDTLKKAEKLLRQGRLDQAIVEYARVVEDQPTDWGTTNTLGDLYVRAGQAAKAAEQYRRIADHFMTEGFYQKAAALYKKLLKLNPQDEKSLLNLAEVSYKQGLLADTKAHLNALAASRRSRGDRAGAAEIVVRLGSIDPADFDARAAAARTLVEMGNDEEAAAIFRRLYVDLLEKGRQSEALDALRESVRLNPYDQQGRVLLAKAAIASGDLETAHSHLDPETVGEDPHLLAALLEIHLKSGRSEHAREVLRKLIAAGKGERQRVLDLAWVTIETDPANAYALVDAVVDAADAAGEYQNAAAMLQEYAARVPDHVPALLKLIEICVDGGLESTMCEAQGRLADAYLNTGHPAEARHVAEDLVAREPWEGAHIDRFRRALVMLKVSDPDTVIAERLSGQSPFTVTDLFAEVGSPRSAEAQAREDLHRISPETQIVEDAAVGVAAPAAMDPSEPRIESTRTAGEITPAVPPQSDTRDALMSPDRSEAPTKQLEQAFNEFRSEVERQSGVDQSAQHMTLARTYLEMGMPDEALSSLELASRATRFRFEAASSLGRIYRDRGDSARAIEWLERAAEAPAPNADEGRALLYDLGTLVEAGGDTARALAIFLELQSDAGDYRDVPERVERLARVEAGG